MKKILFPILLFAMFVPFVVCAKTCDSSSIKIESIEINSKNGNAEEIKKAKINGNRVNLNIKLYDPGDSIEYNLKVKNTSKEDYFFDEKSLKLNTKYLEYNFNYDDNSNVIEARKDKNVQLKVEYKNKVPAKELNNDVFNDTNNMIVNLSDKNIIDNFNIIKNPETGNLLVINMIVLIICIGISLIILKKNKSIKFMILIIGTVLIPTSVYALCKANIEVKSNIQIDGKEAYFLTGSEVNIKMKQLAGTNITSYGEGAVDTNITAIKRSEKEPSDSNKEDKNIVSLSDSPYPIYMWYENGTIYWWSEDKTPSLNKDSSHMFQHLYSLEDLETKHFDSKETTDMSNMFDHAGYNSENISFSFENFDTSNVTNMSEMFTSFAFYSKNVNIDLNNWDIGKVTDMGDMFKYMGYYSKEISIDLHKWNVSSVENMEKMFEKAGCYADKFSINIEGWDLRNYKNGPYDYDFLGAAGYSAKESIANLNNLKLGKDKPSFYSFLKNSKDIKLYMNDWVFDQTNLSNMFSNVFSGSDPHSRYIEAKNWDISKITSTRNIFYQFAYGRSEKTYIDLSGWKISKETPINNLFYDIALYSNNSYIDLSNWDLGDTTNLQYIFYYIAESNESATVNLTGWDTSNVTDMSHMFHNAAIFTNNINIIGLEDLNTSKVTNMEYMFREFDLNAEVKWNLSKWDVSNVTNMRGMFYSIGRQAGGKYSTLDLSDWDVSNVRDASSMFSSMTNLRKIYATSDWTFKSIEDLSSLDDLFYGTTQIVGGNGTKYHGISDSRMAKIDREGVPGFFTLKK